MLARGFLLSAVLPLVGCVVGYLPAVAPPGRFQPDARAGSGELALDFDLSRDLGGGVAQQDDGRLTSTGSADPSRWLTSNLALRWGFSERFALEARLQGSALFPTPIPLPNGAGLAPIIRVADLGPDLAVYGSPRILRTGGSLTAAAGDAHRLTERSGWGYELPATLAWSPSRHFGLAGTVFARGAWMSARTGEDRDSLGPEATWFSSGYGATAQLSLTLGVLRVGLGGAVELAPHPGAGLPLCSGCAAPPSSFVVWQGGVSLGAVWGGR